MYIIWCALGLHDWEKWEQYTWHGYVKYGFQAAYTEVTELRQKRTCIDCGKMQTEKIEND